MDSRLRKLFLPYGARKQACWMVLKKVDTENIF